MSDTTEDYSEESNWVPYSERPDWSDVIPLEQDDGLTVVKIAYSAKCESNFKFSSIIWTGMNVNLFHAVNDVYGYFRAIYKSGEVSQRALLLTADALDLNPANYTVWHHRRHLLKELNEDLSKELQYCRDIIEQHSKNYQVW